MLILLPPSETKRPGGIHAPLHTPSLRFPELASHRERAIDALVALSADADEAARVLKLSQRQLDQVEVNATIRSAATMPAVDRYTGVLFDALQADALAPGERAWLGRHVAIHSAPFGPVGAMDLIPSYRLGAGGSVPGLGSLKRLWSAAVTGALAAESAPFTLDLRSEAYVALGPLPAGDSMYLRVVSPAADGTVRALNHFNKHAKGALVRALATSQPDISSTQDFTAWARAHDVELRQHVGGWDLVTYAVAKQK